MFNKRLIAIALTLVAAAPSAADAAATPNPGQWSLETMLEKTRTGIAGGGQLLGQRNNVPALGYRAKWSLRRTTEEDDALRTSNGPVRPDDLVGIKTTQGFMVRSGAGVAFTTTWTREWRIVKEANGYVSFFNIPQNDYLVPSNGRLVWRKSLQENVAAQALTLTRSGGTATYSSYTADIAATPRYLSGLSNPNPFGLTIPTQGNGTEVCAHNSPLKTVFVPAGSPMTREQIIKVFGQARPPLKRSLHVKLCAAVTSQTFSVNLLTSNQPA